MLQMSSPTQHKHDHAMFAPGNSCRSQVCWKMHCIAWTALSAADQDRSYSRGGSRSCAAKACCHRPARHSPALLRGGAHAAQLYFSPVLVGPGLEHVSCRSLHVSSRPVHVGLGGGLGGWSLIRFCQMSHCCCCCRRPRKLVPGNSSQKTRFLRPRLWRQDRGQRWAVTGASLGPSWH